jgi:hypothetical protein
MMSTLNLIGGLVHDCPTAQPFLDKSPVLFELLADHLGWPSDMYDTCHLLRCTLLTFLYSCPRWVLEDPQVTPVITQQDLFMFELLTIQVFTELRYTQRFYF